MGAERPGPYLLTNLLLPVLEAGAPARIINLSSFIQRLGGIRLDDPEGRRWHFRAQVVLCLATSPDVLGISGRCFKVTSLSPASRASNDEAAARRLWQICELMTREISPSNIC